MDKMFELATRAKLRFPFKGSVSVEDLWDLGVKDLDSIFKALNSRVKAAQEDSLLAAKTTEDEVLSTQIAIVRYIVETKLHEAEVAKRAKETSERKQKIMAIIADKRDEALRSASVEELEAMLDNLDQ